MSSRTLLVEGLPDQLDHIRLKLQVYFTSKKRSGGGEIAELRADPKDKHRAFLVYVDETAFQRVMSKRKHLVDFKDPHGLVELEVKLPAEPDDQQQPADPLRKKPKPPPTAPRPKHTLIHVNSAANEKPEPCQTDQAKDEEGGERGPCSLLVTSGQKKDFLQMYFEQFAAEPTLTKHGRETWILQLPNKSDMEKVCAKRFHDHGISVAVYDEQSTESHLDPRRFVLSGFDDGCICSHVSVYVGSCSHGAQHSWGTLDDGDSIVVTFKQDIDVNDFMRKCSSKKFQDKEIGAHRLEKTDSVFVQGDMSTMSEEVLDLYFSSKRSRGGVIKSIRWVSKDKSAIITFQDGDVAYRVAEQKHSYSSKELKVQLFYCSLQKALTGEMSVQKNITTNTVVPVSAELLSFISRNESQKQTFTSALEKVHASVSITMDTETPQMELSMTLDADTLGMLRHGPTWEMNALREAQVQLNRYSEEHLPADVDIWQEIENGCVELTTTKSCVSFKRRTSKIVVVGTRDQMKTVAEKVRNMVKKTGDDLQIKRDTVEREIHLDTKEKLDLIWDLVSGKMETDVVLSKDEESLSIHIKGQRNAVNTAEGILNKVLESVDSISLDMSPHMMNFIKSLDLKKFQRDHFAQNNITAILIPGDESFQILGFRGDINKAEDKLCKVIQNKVIEITVRGEHWEQFLEALHEDIKSSQNFNNISIKHTGKKIEVCGFSGVVTDVLSKIKDYLEDKKTVTEDVPLKSLQELEFVQSCKMFSDDTDLKALGATIVPSKSQASPCLKVKAASDKIKQATDVVTRLISTIVTEKLMYSKAGEAKILEKNKQILIAQAKLLQCELSLSQAATTNTQAATTNAQAATFPPLPPISNAKVIGGVAVTLKKGDITKEAVDIIVNPTNMDLNLSSGLCGAILKAAGKYVVDHCKHHGSQKADGVVLTRGGNLRCKCIAHMVAPSRAVDLTCSTEKVLQLCEGEMAATVAIPAIGTGRGSISPQDCLKAILKAVENHTSQTASSSLKSICVVAFEDKIFDAMSDVFCSNKPPWKLGVSQATFKAATNTKPDLPPNQVKIHGVMVEVKKGNITQDSVRGIVNTANAGISLTGGVCGAILKAAGPAVEQECQKIRPLKGDQVGVTSGGALQCDFILHLVGPHNATEATARVRNVLECCEQKGIATLSLPAMGTGGGGLSSLACVEAILQGITDHLSSTASTVLKLIYVVLQQDPILQAFEQGFSQWKSKQRQQTMDSDDDDSDDRLDSSSSCSTSEEEEDDTSSQVSIPATNTEAMVGPVEVKVFSGDITREKTDAVVSSTNTSLNLSSGVSAAILKAAGKSVVDECTALGTQPGDGVVITKPGNLSTKHIIHMVGQTKETTITNSMRKVLQMCEDNKLQSVSFPALGTGAGNLGALQVGNAMMAAVEEHVKSTNTTTLKTVHIVIFQAKMLQDFEEAMKRFKKVTPKKPVASGTLAFRPTATKKVRHPPPKTSKPARHNLSTSLSVQLPTLSGWSACSAVSFPTMEAEVMGFSAASLAQVKKIMDDLISEESHSEELSSSQLPLLLGAEKQAIVDLSHKSQVRVLVSSAQDKVSISGKKDDVLAAVLKIREFLQKAKDRESRRGEEKRLSEMVRWEVAVGKSWREMDQSVSLDIEHAHFNKQPNVSYQHRGLTHTVDLKSMQCTDAKGTITRVKRTLKAVSETAVIQPPPTWTQMHNKNMDVVDVAPTSGEYKTVVTELINTSTNPHNGVKPTIQVVKVQRIQNTDQWQRYTVMKQMLDKRYPTNRNEMNLYHGTTSAICQKINACGFNRSFCGRNATVYGNGTYFAKESWYSLQPTYSNPDANGNKYIYRARVLVGKPCKGTSGMLEPSPLNPADIEAGLHDCAVDDPLNPFIYVVFCDAGAYPDYLITFKTS